MPGNGREALIDALLEGGVEFVVIGGMAAMLRGAPLMTADVDIIHDREPANVDRELSVLRAIRARLRADSRNIVPTASMLSGRGHVLLDTTLGPIDALCEIGDGQDDQWLLPRSVALPRGSRSRRSSTSRSRRRPRPDPPQCQPRADSTRRRPVRSPQAGSIRPRVRTARAPSRRRSAG